MAESNKIFCEPCEHSGLSVKASVWCNDCDEGFCDECIKGHKLTKVLRNHHIVSIADHLEVSYLDINQTCPSHSKPFDSFCRQHDQLLCLSCIQLEEHGKCGELLRIHDAAEGVKTSTAISIIDDSISAILQNITENIKYNDDNDQSLSDKKEAIKSKIDDTRKKINMKLDQLTDKLLDELNSKFRVVSSEHSEFKHRLKQNERKILQLQTRLYQIQSHVSDVQTFIGMKNIEKSVYDEKLNIQGNMIKLQQYSLDLNINSKLKSVMDELQSFGAIIVDVKSVRSQYTDPDDKQAQQEAVPTWDIDKIKLNKMKGVKITIGSDFEIGDCTILPTKDMVFTDKKNKRLIVYNKDRKFENEVRIANIARCITTVDSDKIAVTYSYHVSIVNVRTKSEKTFTIRNSECSFFRDLSFYDGKLYIVEAFEGIKVMTLDGIVTNTTLKHIEDAQRIKVFNERLYYTACKSKNVYCYDLKGNHLWTFSDDRLFQKVGSASFTIDSHDNVLVAGTDSAVVLAVSSDKQVRRVLLDKSDGLYKPFLIHFDEKLKQLLVYDKEYNYGHIYELQ